MSVSERNERSVKRQKYQDEGKESEKEGRRGKVEAETEASTSRKKARRGRKS